MEVTEDRIFTVTTVDGEQIEVAGKVTTTTDGFDKDGNPVQSVKINVPPIDLGATPGEVN